MHQSAGDDLRLLEGRDAEGHVRLAPAQAVEPGIGQQLHHDPGLQAGELGQDRRQHMDAEPVGGCEAQRPFERGVLTAELALDG